MKQIVAIELWAYRKPLEAERTLQVNAKDLVLLSKTHDPAYGYKVYNAEQIEWAKRRLIDNMGYNFDHYQGYHLKFIELSERVESLYREEVEMMEKEK
jgi:hypothetical protein